MPIDLNGKAVLVVGSSGGIGQATAEAFARAGARVVAAGRSGGKLAAADTITLLGNGDVLAIDSISNLAATLTGFVGRN